MTRVQIVQQYSRICKTITKISYHSSLIQLEILEMSNEKLSSTVTPESVIILSKLVPKEFCTNNFAQQFKRFAACVLEAIALFEGVFGNIS